jgi:hypothetical protein
MSNKIPEVINLYVPFTEKDIEFLRNKWVVYKENPIMQYQITHFTYLDDEFYIGSCSAKMLLDLYTFLDGSQCGHLNPTIASV